MRRGDANSGALRHTVRAWSRLPPPLPHLRQQPMYTMLLCPLCTCHLLLCLLPSLARMWGRNRARVVRIASSVRMVLDPCWAQVLR